MAVEYTDIGIPEKIKIYWNFQQMRIVRQWFGYKFIVYTLFAIVWDAFLISFYMREFSSALQGFPDIPFLLFPLIHVAVGIGLTYYALAGYINKTTIDVDFSSVRVRQGPLPFWGNQSMPSKTITQLYCKRDSTYANRSFYQTFAVRAITGERRNIKLVSGLDTSEQALFIEQEIEKFLKIEDKRVKGEIR